jgi:predicted small secreted protein
LHEPSGNGRFIGAKGKESGRKRDKEATPLLRRAFNRSEEKTIRKDRTMRKIFAMMLMLIAAVPLTACATVKGAGSDLSSASDAVNDEIHDRNK